MIPKIIHYCWFGRLQKNELVIKCMDTWKKLLPDYEIVEWNEDNFDVNSSAYTKDAYRHKRYAFVADYVRLHALKQYGGIYLDTDVEVVKNLNEFLDNKSFLGYEHPQRVATCLMGSEKDGTFINDFFNIYNNNIYHKSNITPNTQLLRSLLRSKNVALNGEFTLIADYTVIYPIDYFVAKIWETGKYCISDNTYAVHHYNASWVTPAIKIRNVVRKIIKG